MMKDDDNEIVYNLPPPPCPKKRVNILHWVKENVKIII